jgi:predicted aminopeptidase
MDLKNTANNIIKSLLLLILFSNTGCSPAYVLQAAAGQYRIMNHSIPVAEALQKDSLTPEQKEKLKLVALIKQFGEQELGLKQTGNYQTVYLESNKNPLYVISAAPKDKLAYKTWWFPVVGHVPYLSYFNLKKAQLKKEKLFKKDLDVIIGIADAYSTLGWFQDPVTLNLLNDSTVDLVETLLHELTHTTLYVKGQGEFNEGLAMLVGREGARLFLETHFGPDHPLSLAARQILEDQQLFSVFLDNLLTRLETLYNGPLAYTEKLKQRELIFKQALDDFSRIKTRFKTDQFIYFGHEDLNNAYLLAIGLYHRHFPAFEKVLQQKNNSLPETIRFFQTLAGEKKNLIAVLGELTR